MIKTLNKLNISTINGGEYALCQMQDLQVRELHTGTYWFDSSAQNECCNTHKGLRWWNKNKGECSPVTEGKSNPLSVNDLNTISKEKIEKLISDQEILGSK